MDTSVLVLGEGTKPPLPLKSSLHTEAARGPAEWPVENAKDFSSSEAGRQKTSSCTTVLSHELFALISVPCYLSSQDWGPFIIPSVMARSNLHCQRLKPVTSSNSITRTGTKQKLVRWLRPQTTATLVPLLYQDGPTDGKARFPGQVRPTLAVSTTHSRIWPCLPSQSLQVEYYASHRLVTLTLLYFSYKTMIVLKSSPQMLPF